MRSKTEYVIEIDEKGKSAPRKVGMSPVQRDGMEYEFDIVAEMNVENEMVVQKSRCEALSGKVIAKPNGQVAGTLRAWLTDGVPQREMTPAERWHRWASTVLMPLRASPAFQATTKAPPALHRNRS